MLEFDLIETPENVVLERRLAGIGSRLIAGMLDTAVLAAIYIVLVLLAIFGTPIFENLFKQGWLLVAVFVFLFYAVYWGYFAFFEYVWNGQTPGKRRMRIRVVKDEGRPIRFTDVAIRNLLRVVDGLAFYFVAGLVMFVTQKVQRLGDLAAGTLVVSEQPVNYAPGDRGKIELTVETTEAALPAGLTAEQHRVLATYCQRRDQLTLDARERLLRTVVAPILVNLKLVRQGAPMSMLNLVLHQLMTGTLPGPAASRTPAAKATKGWSTVRPWQPWADEETRPSPAGPPPIPQEEPAPPEARS